MRLFAIGDLHLSLDDRVDKPMDVFGPLWRDHACRLKENWEKTVSEEDTVLVVGDISWGLKLSEAMADLTFLHELPGRKVCIKGNHDLWWHGITKMNRLFDDILFLQNHACETETAVLCGSRGWVCPGDGVFTEQDETIYKRELLRLEASLAEGERLGEETGKPLIGMLHYPPTNERHQPSGFTDLFEKYSVSQVYYGHLHGREVFPKGLKGPFRNVRYHLVSLDYVDATPREVIL